MTDRSGEHSLPLPPGALAEGHPSGSLVLTRLAQRLLIVDLTYQADLDPGIVIV